MLNNAEILDGHVHYSPQITADFIAGFLTEMQTEKAVLQCVSHSGCISLNPGALAFKHRYPDRFYVFGCLNASEYYLHHDEIGRYQAEYVRRMFECGIDGVKMLEGKPQLRKTLPVPDFDCMSWEPFWKYAEEEQIPFVWHVNDPETFWGDGASEWVKAQGWHYDESDINNEVQYAQVLEVLRRHPWLKISFAHFFFMSARLDRLDAIMDACPNVMVDMTPGIELYENLSRNPEQTKAFFEKHHDRIYYGTDIGGRCVLSGEGKTFNVRENERRAEIVRTFIGTDDAVTVEADGNLLIGTRPFVMRSLGLKGERLEEVVNGNLRRHIGHESGRVCPEAVLEECAFLRKRIDRMADEVSGFRPDVRDIDRAEAYFRSL